MNFDGVLVVFTAKTIEQMLKLGGSASWVLNPKSMRGVTHVVCTRNSDHQFDEECGPRSEAHNSAFMVGKVSGLKKVERLNDRDRYLVQFSDYALVEVPNFRSGSTRNPVTYSDVDQCKFLGIDIETLEFKPMPDVETEGAPNLLLSPAPKKGLTIAEAKRGLSQFFEVPVDNVQITINA